MRIGRLLLLLSCAMALAAVGCFRAPGRPEPGEYARRPDQTLDFQTLYAENCVGCHGAHGVNGAALSMANPVYLHYAGVARVQQITAQGIPGTLMPAYARSHGGMLTDRQIEVLTQGMMAAWAGSDTDPTPAYTPVGAGDANAGQQVFATFCARCHGANGTGAAINKTGLPTHGGQRGSLVDPAYLALISDAGLRSIVVAGQPEQGMPNWRNDGPRPLTEPEITDVVAWLAQHRTPTPGQIYAPHL